MISIVVAMDKNRVIGKDNQLPWHLPADLNYFKTVTMGKPIVMGRKTYESIGRPLPGRENIIITRNRGFHAEGCTIEHSIDYIKKLSHDNNIEVCVIGGSEIFHEVLPISDRLYITEIEHEFLGDTFFPKIDKEEWMLTKSEQGPKDEKNPYTYFFHVYEKR